MHVGIDVGGTKVQAATRVASSLRTSQRCATPDAYDELLDAMAALCRSLSCDGEPIEGAAVGVPGQATDMRVEWVPNVHCLDGRDLSGDLSARLGCPVSVANDAQLALLGEAHEGAARGADSAVLFSIGTGVGGALMVDGRVVRGSRGAAGAFGWISLDVEHTPDVDHGWLELNASGRALESIGAAMHPPRTPEQVVADTRGGDPACVVALERVARALGMSAAVIASTVDPETVMFSGGLVDAFDLLDDALREAFAAHASPVVRGTPLVPAALGGDAALWGAVHAAESA